MATERETRSEHDFWGNECQYIYENGKRVGEYRAEERGGFLGIGDERQTVEYDIDDKEVGYTREERRGGILGIGEEQVEGRYNRKGERQGYSRVEERGGFLGVGTHHARIGYDEDDHEESSTQWERRGGIFGLGEHRVRLTRYNAPNRGGGAGSDSSASGWSADLGDGVGKLIFGVMVVAVVVWIVFAVIVPLAVINTASLALVGAVASTTKRKALLVVSTVGAGYILLDYNIGWLSRELTHTLPFMGGWMLAFVCFNVSAGLVSAYPLLRRALAATFFADEEMRAQRQMMLAGGLVAIGGAILGAQIYADLRWRANPSVVPETIVTPVWHSAPASNPARYSAVPTPDVVVEPPVSQAQSVKPALAAPPSSDPQPGTKSRVDTRLAKDEAPTPKIYVPPGIAAPPTIACVLPDGREIRLTAERCEGTGGMEYR